MYDRPFNLTEFVLDQSPAADTKEALVQLAPDLPRKSLSYGELRRLVGDRARILLQHASRGEHILLRLDQSLDYAVWFLAVIRAGLVAVPLSVQLTAEEVEFAARDADAKLILRDTSLSFPSASALPCEVWDHRSIVQSHHPVVSSRTESDYSAAPLPSTFADDPAFIVYTSGTSGFPKGVVHAHRVVLGRALMFESWTGIQETDRVLHAGQLNWTYAMGVGVLDPLRAGATGFIASGNPNPSDWAQWIGEERLTIFAAVPGLYRKIIKYDAAGLVHLRDSGSLRHALTAGAPLPEELYHVWKENTGCELYEALGMSEISTYISTGPQITVRPGSPGKPQSGRRIAILHVEKEKGNVPLPRGEIGLLAVHTSDPGLMLKYLHTERSDASAFRGEWFTGGDLAHIDQDGYVHFHGRSDELMNAFGYRVSPVEIERILNAHPSVQEAAAAEVSATGRQDVTIICAFIVLRTSTAGAEEGWLSIADRKRLSDELLRYASEHLAAYKCPREVRFVSDLPRNRNGKLDRANLALL